MIYIPSNLNKGFEIFIKEYKRGQHWWAEKYLTFFIQLKKHHPRLRAWNNIKILQINYVKKNTSFTFVRNHLKISYPACTFKRGEEIKEQ